MIFDADDMHDTNNRLDLLVRLKEANPAFKMTAFAVPGLCSLGFLETLPDWIEVAAHGWRHGGPGCTDARECENWTYEQTMDVLLNLPGRFVDLWKSPGWQISDGTYMALEELGWAVADQHYNDHRRPSALRFHCEGDGDHVHTHVQDVCDNGLAQSFPLLLRRVERTTEFQFVSEAVQSSLPVPELV